MILHSCISAQKIIEIAAHVLKTYQTYGIIGISITYSAYYGAERNIYENLNKRQIRPANAS